MRNLPAGAKMVFQGEIFSIWQWNQKRFDGSTAIYEGVGRVDASLVICVLPSGKLLLTKDEQPHRQPLISLPGGKVNKGETATEAAHREVLEETGYRISQLQLYFSQGFGASILWQVHFFVGRNVEKVAEAAPDPGERITPLEFTFDEFLQLGARPDFRHPELGLKLLEAQLDKKKHDQLYSLLYE